MVVTAINQNPAKGIAGQRWGMDHQVRTYINNAPNTAKVVDITPTAVNSTAYQFEVNGVPITFTSDASATVAEVRDGLIAALQADPFASLVVTAAPSGNDIRLTEIDPDEGEVTITESDANLALAVVTTHSQEEPVVPGVAVAQGPNDGDLRLLPNGAAETTITGVSLHAHGQGNSALNGSGLYDPNTPVPVLHDGEVLVQVENAVTPASGVYARHTPSGVNTTRGKFRSDADTATAVLVTNARFQESGSAGDLVRLSVKRP